MAKNWSKNQEHLNVRVLFAITGRRTPSLPLNLILASNLAALRPIVHLDKDYRLAAKVDGRATNVD